MSIIHNHVTFTSSEGGAYPSTFFFRQFFAPLRLCVFALIPYLDMTRHVAGNRGRPARLHSAPGLGESDFGDAAELNQLRRLYETLQLEIITVIESPGRLKESPEHELCQISEKKSGVLDELAAERAKQLEKESAELETQADKLAEEIKELSGETVERIV